MTPIRLIGDPDARPRIGAILCPVSGFELPHLFVAATWQGGCVTRQHDTTDNLAVWSWDRLFAAGELRGIRAMGSDALDLLRIEAGFILAGVDFLPAMEAVRPTHTRSPFELGNQWKDLELGA